MWSCDSVVILPKNSWWESLLEFLKISPAIPLKMSAGVLLKIPPGLGPSGIAGGILTKIPDGIPARVSFLIPRKKILEESLEVLLGNPGRNFVRYSWRNSSRNLSSMPSEIPIVISSRIDLGISLKASAFLQEFLVGFLKHFHSKISKNFRRILSMNCLENSC